MSKKSKSKEFKPRDPKGRFTKTTDKIPLDLFGGKNTPPTNPSKRYTSSKPKEGQSSVINRTQSPAEAQSELTVDGIVGSPQKGRTIVEQTNMIENTTSFLEIPREEAIVSLEKVQEEKIQEGILTPIHPFKTRDNPLIEPFFTEPNLETKTFSLFGNMAGEEEERVLNEP